jgi:hypothetical protein
MSHPTYPQPPVDRSVKIPHLVFGLLFLGIAGIWALVVTDVINADRLPVLAPTVLIVAGVVGLAVSLASGRNRRHAGTVQGEPFHDDTYDTTTTDTTTDYAVTDDDEHTEEIR